MALPFPKLSCISLSISLCSHRQQCSKQLTLSLEGSNLQGHLGISTCNVYGQTGTVHCVGEVPSQSGKGRSDCNDAFVLAGISSNCIKVIFEVVHL